MQIIITDGTLFTPTLKTQRYEETARLASDISHDTTIAELTELIDRERPPWHLGGSYLSLPVPHRALPDHATLRELGIAGGSTLRRFSRVRS